MKKSFNHDCPTSITGLPLLAGAVLENLEYHDSHSVQRKYNKVAIYTQVCMYNYIYIVIMKFIDNNYCIMYVVIFIVIMKFIDNIV